MFSKNVSLDESSKVNFPSQGNFSFEVSSNLIENTFRTCEIYFGKVHVTSAKLQ